MASRSELQQEIQAWQLRHPGENPLDGVRREKLAALRQMTGRPVLVYAADWFNPLKIQLQQQISSTINLTDKDHFAELVGNVSATEIDLIVHSPGGSAEATESIVALLRSKFTDIRVFVPGTAKSAATMLAMSANLLALDDLSELGPIDPQMILNGRPAPAGAILKQFQIAEAELKADPGKITAWLPMLQQYGPSILVECQNHLDLSKRLVSSWLKQYMFAGESSACNKADSIASWLADDSNFLSHSRRIGITDLEEKGIKFLNLNTEPDLKERVRQIYLSIMLTFELTPTFKLFENSEGTTVVLGIVIQPDHQSQ